MNRLLSTSAFLVFFSTIALFSQPVLQPSIGLDALPPDEAPVCPIPLYTGSFEASGLQAGEAAIDFTLYNLDGESFTLSEALSEGKPVLLVSGSYTCPVFRNKTQVLNNIASQYGDQLKVVIIYTPEAHPDIDISPYFGFVNTTAQNINAGILYKQPVTYGEKKAIVSDMLAVMNIVPEVFIDGPCNEWWLNYGPAPNNAYLIDTTGIIFAKHGWFDKFPKDIFCDIESLFGNPLPCNNGGSNGAFSFQQISGTSITGTPGNTITMEGKLTNTSSQPVQILVKRLQNNLATGWSSALCLDVCYGTDVDSTIIKLDPGQTQSFHFYFFTSAEPGTSTARVGFRNQSNTTNKFSIDLEASTTETTLTFENPQKEENPFEIYPNVTSGMVALKLNGFENGTLAIFDMNGLKRASLPWQENLDMTDLPAGWYFVRASGMAGEQKVSAFFKTE